MSHLTDNWIQTAPGVKRNTVAVGKGMMQMAVYLEKGAKVPKHSHVHEQIASVLSGKLRFFLGDAGEVRDVNAGESIVLLSNVPHGVDALEESWVLDTFNPPREDLLKIDSEQGKGVK